MFERKKLLMEFGIEALKNALTWGALPVPPESLRNIPTASSMRKKTYRRQPLRAKAVRDSLMNEQGLGDENELGGAPERNPDFVSAEDQAAKDSIIKADNIQNYYAKQGHLGFKKMAQPLEKPKRSLLPPRNYPKLSYNVRGGVSQDSAPRVDPKLNYRGMGFNPRRAR